MQTEQPDIRIVEIFGPTIQGEGALIGQPTVFVRSGGCDYRCVWCDTMYAVDSDYRDQWTPMTASVIWKRIAELSGNQPLMVSLSGGNPATQPFAPLIELGQRHGYRFALETQGSIAQDWFSMLDVLTLSPKPPSSLMATDWDNFDACVSAAGEKPETVMKIVIFDEEDYLYAKDAARRYPLLPLYLQPGNHTPPPPDESDAPIDLDGIRARLDWLIGKVTSDRWFDATVLPQLHVMLWGNKRGV
jgi:7-carboxy-7-deazaguanine synthase